MNEEHFRCLESMYVATPINDFYKPKIEVREGEATLEIEISEKYYHAAEAYTGLSILKYWMMRPFCRQFS